LIVDETGKKGCTVSVMFRNERAKVGILVVIMLLITPRAGAKGSDYIM